MPSAITEQNTGGVERLDIAGSCLTGRGPNFAHIVRSSLLINICSTPNPILRQRQPSEEGRFCLLLRPLWIGFDTLWTPRQESSCWRRHCTVSLLCCRRNEQPDAPLAVSSRPRSGEPRLNWHAERGNHHGADRDNAQLRFGSHFPPYALRPGNFPGDICFRSLSKPR